MNQSKAATETARVRDALVEAGYTRLGKVRTAKRKGYRSFIFENSRSATDDRLVAEHILNVMFRFRVYAVNETSESIEVVLES